MSERSSIDGGYWLPLGARRRYGRPEVGWLIAFDHQAWRIVEVRDHDTDTVRPYKVRLRPAALADHPDPVRAKARDRHIGAPKHWEWHVYPDPEHYPVCSSCSEPMPCREETGRRMAERAVEKMGRYERAGVCPACEEPITRRQQSITFDENVEIPGGPPVTFHRRGKCVSAAALYEQRWAALAPDRRRALTCDGDLTNHNDGTYECTETDNCPGPVVAHLASASMCTCEDCHSRPWTWGRGCQPASNARLRGADESTGVSQRSLFSDPREAS